MSVVSVGYGVRRTELFVFPPFPFRADQDASEEKVITAWGWHQIRCNSYVKKKQTANHSKDATF